MGIMMFVMFYTSRVVLNALGINNFGTWNVINSFVISFSFISAPMVTSTQRFLNFDMGKGGENLVSIFNTSLFIFIILGFVSFLLLEIFGLWFINSKMNFEYESMYVVNVVYQLMIVSFICKIIRLPYEAAIIAYEEMSFYALISLLEAFLLLCMAFTLKFFSSNQILITYGILTFIVQFCITVGYIIFSLQKLECSKFKFGYKKEILKEIGSFSGWNLLVSISSLTATSGLNVVANMFFGVTINAAYGVTTQLGGAVNQFVVSFQRAVNPQIVKSYALHEYSRLEILLYGSCKFSFLVMLIIVIPMFFNIDIVLKIWLGNEVPIYTSLFCRIYLIYLLFMCFATLLDYAVLATGKIKTYQMLLSVIVFLNIVFTYCLFKIGFPPYSLFVVKTLLEIVILCIRFGYLKKEHLITLKGLFLYTIKPCLIVASISLITYMLIMLLFRNHESILRLWLSILVFIPIYILCCWQFAFSPRQKSFVLNKLKSFL